jgi:hypothetical protein
VIRVLTWLWNQPAGRTKFAAEHVNVWAAMVDRHLAMPHRIACVTDMPEGIDGGVEIIAPPGDFEDVEPSWGPTKPNCYRRLSMFRKDAADLFGERFACMDLDCVVGAPLDPLFDRPEDLVLLKGSAPERPYNGSMMLIRAGCRPQVYDRFDQAGADASGERFIGSDQAWLAHCLGWGEKTWSEKDGAFFYGPLWAQMPGRARVLFFPGKIKPWTLAQLRLHPFVTNNYVIETREAA